MRCVRWKLDAPALNAVFRKFISTKHMVYVSSPWICASTWREPREPLVISAVTFLRVFSRFGYLWYLMKTRNFFLWQFIDIFHGNDLIILCKLTLFIYILIYFVIWIVIDVFIKERRVVLTNLFSFYPSFNIWLRFEFCFYVYVNYCRYESQIL